MEMATWVKRTMKRSPAFHQNGSRVTKRRERAAERATLDVMAIQMAERK